MEFNCSQCGACCRIAGELGFMPSREDGACIHLGEDNLCTIYDERPDICNVEKMYYKRKLGITKKEYFKMQNEACNLLQKSYGMDEKYRVDPEIYNKEY